MTDLANEILSDEEYLDSLLEKLSEREEKKKEDSGEAISENMPSKDALAMEEGLLQDDIKIDDAEMSQEEMEAAADETLDRLLQEGVQNADFDTDISLEQLINRERELSFDEENETEDDAGEVSLDGLKGVSSLDDSADELLDSLSAIVQEIQEDDIESASDAFSGTDDLKGKKKEKSRKPKKMKKQKSGFGRKMKDAFFKVETVDLAEEEMQEKQRLLEKQEKEKEKAEQKAQDKAKKQEEKKAADARKRELAQQKKQERQRKLQEKKAKKAEQEAALGIEERIRIKPAFVAFVATVIAVLTIAIVLLSDNYAYRNNLNIAERCFAVKNYKEAYRVISGMELEKEDQELYQKIFLLVRLDKQYDAYVNFKNMKMDKEALNALIQGMTIYYASVEEGKTLGLETEMNEQKDNIVYSLADDYGLNEERAKQICEIADTNEYTREIELYSSSQIQ